MSDQLDQLLKEALQRTSRKIEAMSEEERGEYNRRAKQTSRERQRQGSGKPSQATVRDLLADIAIMMLASNADGAMTIQTALARHFGERVGFPMQIKSDAKRGKLKPKVIRPERDVAV